jgi:hypothetical protein
MTAAEAAGCSVRLGRLGFGQELFGVVCAAAALRGDAELALQVRHAARALLDAAADVAVGDAVADADVHAVPPASTGTIINKIFILRKR